MNFLQFVGLAVLFYIGRYISNWVSEYLNSPLRKFPGPFLAGVTNYYRAYYDVWLDGGFLDQMKVLHEKYGPVIRVSPTDLHFSSPEAYFDIYFENSKWHKDVRLYNIAGRAESSVGFADPAVAQKRRAILAPMFSRKAVLHGGLEEIIHAKMNKMVEKSVAYYAKTKKAVNIYRGLRCVSEDIISEYAFGACFNTLDTENFTHPMIGNVKRSIHGVWYIRHLPWIVQKFLVLIGVPAFTGTMDMRNFIRAPLDIVWMQRNTAGFAEKKDKTIYHALLAPSKGYVPPDLKSCLDEGMTVVGAGGENTGSTTTVGTFLVVSQPELYKRIQAELRSVWPNPNGPAPRLEELEKLPLLSGVVKESLRFGHGATVALPRIVGPSGGVIGGYTIPPGTSVAQAHPFMHENPNIFPDPLKFDPDRWCQPNSKDLEHYLVAFSRGPRKCLAYEVALAELYIMFAYTFRKMNIEIYNTTMEDFKWRQYLIPYFHKEFHANITPATY